MKDRDLRCVRCGSQDDAVQDGRGYRSIDRLYQIDIDTVPDAHADVNVCIARALARIADELRDRHRGNYTKRRVRRHE